MIHIWIVRQLHIFKGLYESWICFWERKLQYDWIFWYFKRTSGWWWCWFKGKSPSISLQCSVFPFQLIVPTCTYSINYLECYWCQWGHLCEKMLLANTSSIACSIWSANDGNWRCCNIMAEDSANSRIFGNAKK